MIRLLSLFSGIGAFEKALDRIGAEYELVNYCEIDKYASVSYAAVHGVSEELNLRDITKVDEQKLKDKGINLVTYGFPCVDISVAGKQRGFEHNGQKTRSGLFFDALRIISAVKPAVCLAENVKALTGKKFQKEFATVMSSLEQAGYNSHVAVLNAKDYGIPQNRERVFILSVRKDIDLCFFEWPEKKPLTLRLKDLLEPEVDESFYCKNERALKLAEKLAEQYKKEPMIVASRGRNPENPNDRTAGINTEQRFEINKQGIANTITTVQKDNYLLESKIIDDTQGFEAEPRIYDNVAPTLRSLRSGLKIMQVANFDQDCRKRDNPQTGRVYSPDGLSPTLLTMQGGEREPKIAEKQSGAVRIRKLTPKECWRLMGFDDDDFEKARAAGISNTQLYKQAGNSIVVNVLERIFEKLIEAQGIGDRNE